MFTTVKGLIAGLLTEYGVSAINLEGPGHAHGDHGHGHGDHIEIDSIDHLLVGGTGYGVADFDVDYILDDFYSY